MKMNNFRDDLTDVLAETKAPDVTVTSPATWRIIVLAGEVFFKIKLFIFLDILTQKLSFFDNKNKYFLG